MTPAATETREVQLRAAADAVPAARARLAEVIAQAAAEGWSMRRIAEATGLSHQRVHQILRESPSPQRRSGQRIEAMPS